MNNLRGYNTQVLPAVST